MMVSVRPEQARGEFPVVELPKFFFLKSKIQFFFLFPWEIKYTKDLALLAGFYLMIISR